jgi:tetratricopeptide (TPR) repeat protein
MGQYAPALSNINKALLIDSTDISSIGIKAKICIEMGLIPAAIEEADKILSLQPESDYGYYQRGWFKMQNGNYSEAIEDLSMVIMLVPQVSLAYCIRGSIYNHIGKTDLAQADFRKVIELEENKPDEYDQIPFAYHYSGENDKAIAAMERIIARDTTDEGSYYDAACLYALMQDKENAIRYLKKSLELGYNQFVHIERDYDLDFIRETEEFKELIQQYRKRTATQQQADTVQIKTEYTSITEIPFSKEDGVCKVRCKINGLP